MVATSTKTGAQTCWSGRVEGPYPYGWTGRTLGAADLNGLGRSDLVIGTSEFSVMEDISAAPGHLTLFLTDGL